MKEETGLRFSIVRVDKNRTAHLTVKPAAWLLERITKDTRAGDIAGLRDYVANYGDTVGYEQRRPVARVYPSVVLAKRDNGRLDAEAFNGVVTLHVGGLMTAVEREAVKQSATMMPMTLAAFVGGDGRSVEILVSVAPSDGGLPADERRMDAFCKVAYEAAFGAYGGVLPKPVERQLVTVRSCFMMTLDEHPYVGRDVRPLRVDMTPAAVDVRPDMEVPQQTDTDMTLYADYELMYKQAAEEAYEETADVVAGQRTEAYITDLARRLAEMGVPEEETFVHLRNHHRYRGDVGEVTMRAIVSTVYAEQHPRRRDDVVRVSRETRRLIDFMRSHYVLRRNTVMGYTEFRPNNTWIDEWAPCTVEVINGMTFEARLANLDVTFNDVKRYVQSDKIVPVDPVDTYFSRIHDAWDGQTDHIAEVARMVPCDFPEWERLFRKWFLGMVAQWLGLTYDYGNSIMPLLVSAQGDGKSTFCRQLLPPELRWGFLENIDIREKRQTLQAMHNFLLINIDEFNQLSASVQEGFLKNVIQLPSVKIKPPYGRHVVDFRRMASFIATTNEQNVLSDITGSRRFVCIRLTAPIDNSVRLNYDALYAQAYRLLTAGSEQYWLTPDEVQTVMDHNRQFEKMPPVAYYFNEYYEAVQQESEGTWLSATAIYNHLCQMAGAGLNVKGITVFGRFLKHLPGLQSKRSSHHEMYLVREK